MGILAGDIKLVTSQVMDDVPEGGGAPTANIIVDGTSNSVFNDISELDRAGGRVNLRKLHASVRTLDTDGYFGVNVIVADPPDDPLVSVSLFTTRDVFDRRQQAVSRLEAYLNAGPEWAGVLYEAHITGQRSIQLFQRLNQPPPPIGRTLLIRENEGLSTVKEQYVRVTRVTVDERTFTYNVDSDYQANIITCDISDALRFDFTGTSANRAFARATGAAIVRDTIVADAATYYSTVPLTAPVAIGDVAAAAASVFTQLVPNSRTETSLVDVRPAASFTHVLATAPRAVEVGGSPFAQRIRIGQENRSFNYVTILTPLPAPGSGRVTFRALGNNYTIVDNGDGTLGGGGAAGSGTINYLTGSVSVTLNALPDDRSAVVFYWGENVTYTNRSGSLNYRAPEFAFNLEHQGVIPGTLTIEWTSGGTLRTATANASGRFTGDAVGEVNHNAGIVFLRPSFMLDAGGTFNIEYEWAAIEEELFPGLTPDGAGAVSFILAEQPAPGSVALSWLTTRETTASSGSVSAAGSTTKDSAAGRTTNTSIIPGKPEFFSAYPPVLYSGGSAGAGQGYSGAAGAPATATFVTSTGAWLPGKSSEVTTTNWSSTSSSDSSSYSTTSRQTSRNGTAVAHLITDDGSGAFFGALGTVGYVSKAVVIKVVSDYSENSFESNYERASAWEELNETGASTTTAGGPEGTTATTGGGGSESARGGSTGSNAFREIYGSSTMIARYRRGIATPASHTETYEPPGVTLDLTPYTKDYIVPGSVRFTWMGHSYEDFEGKVYRARTLSDPGILSGTIDYYAGVVAMSDYLVGGTPGTIALDSLWTTKRPPDLANVTFNTGLAPIKPSGLVLSVVDATGQQIIATSVLDGTLTGPHVRGQIDYETGLVEVQFGDYVLDSTLTAEQKAEWWYDAGDVLVSDGKIWRPWPVDANTLRYSYVSFFYLPLDASILGLDPVRLPQDGRVPIFRPGAFAVLGHTGTVGPATVSNGQVINCGRVRLSRVRVIDANGDVIDTGYTADLDTGLVTFTNVSTYAQPVTVEHRIEDMAMVSDVQINGTVSFTRQITHAYPVPGSYLSSALVAGDLRARVSLVMDQATWTNVWSDNLIGSAATATFNNIAYPLSVVNRGALTERWAVIFTNSTSFNVVGEHVGVIASGNTSTDCSPLNPATGTPYFTIPALGWGLGWSTGNVLRFNTVGCFFPIWAVRTIQQGPETVIDDSFTLLVRGDVDRP